MFYVIVKWQVIFPKKMFYHAVIILRSVPVILQCSIFKVNVLSGRSGDSDFGWPWLSTVRLL